jgi:hypothetical protein
LVGVPDAELVALRARLVTRLVETADFTPGTFQVERPRCGKPGCHCGVEGDPGHTPRYTVMRYEAGKTVKRTVPAGLARLMRARVETWGVFKASVDRIADVNTEMSRRMLAGERVGANASPSGEKKGGSSTRRPSTG